jgi:O-methyltransferase
MAKLRSLVEGGRYAYGYVRHKFDAFQAFGDCEEGTHLPHSVVRPVATYSPWRTDRDFHATFEVIRDHTLVDFYRCYDLWNLVAEAAKLPGGDILEVGVWRGGTGCLLARRAALLGVDAAVHLCDTFAGVVKAGSQDRHYDGGEHSDTSSEIVRELAERLGLDKVRILQGIFPDDTGQKIEMRRFRLCHIDVDVYDSASEILKWVWPRMMPGGIVVFDDYGFLSTGGITQLVAEERTKADRIMTHNLNGHAVFVKLYDLPQSGA